MHLPTKLVGLCLILSLGLIVKNVIMLTCKQVDAGENQRRFAVLVIEKEIIVAASCRHEKKLEVRTQS